MKKIKKVFVLLLMCFLVSMVSMPVSASAAKLNKKSLSLNVGKSYTLKASGTKGKITWTSSKKSVATVSSKGVVKAKKKGTAVITAKYGKSKLTCKVTVKQPVTSVKLSQNSASIEVGKSVTLKATVAPTAANNKAVTWKSGNTSVAIVSSNGVVTGRKSGTTTITATAKDGSKKKASCKVTVKGAAPVANPNKPTDNSTVITTSKQLIDILASDSKGRTYILGKDIDLSGYITTTPYFYGTLDGNGHRILNIRQALVKYNYGTIKNIIFDACNIKGINDKICAVAFRNEGVIDNCIVKGNISVVEGGCAAGLVIENNKTISHCVNYANVSANGYYKDILGNDQFRSAKSGGICFVSYGIVEKCTNYGTIEGAYSVGGIVGHNYAGIINYVINYGKVVQNYSDNLYNDYKGIGGIAGYCQCGKIYNSLNAGDIGNRSGIIGYNYYYLKLRT